MKHWIKINYQYNGVCTYVAAIFINRSAFVVEACTSSACAYHGREISPVQQWILKIEQKLPWTKVDGK